MSVELVDRMVEATTGRDVMLRILFLGDAMTDVYLHGRMEACPDGCDKFIEERRVEVPGGAANAARSLTNWRIMCLCPWDQSTSSIKTRLMVGDRCVLRHDLDRRHEPCLELVRDEALSLLSRR